MTSEMNEKDSLVVGAASFPRCSADREAEESDSSGTSGY